jgi:hypothetical protein
MTNFSSMWNLLEKGITIGTKGSENGIIIDDLEYENRARICLEKKGDIAPFSITFGIYGAMFHTHFTNTEEEAVLYVNKTKYNIITLLDHLDIPEHQRTNGWNQKFNQLISLLTDQISN